MSELVTANALGNDRSISIEPSSHVSRVMADSQLTRGDWLNAANCFDLGKEFPALLNMAAAWLKLAAITEEFNETVVIDKLQTNPIA
jgi:hypothetical protein